MAYKKIDVSELALCPFTKWSQEWALITVADGEKVNTMTAAWGGLGVLWSRNIATVYIHPDRYTHSFMEKAGTFSITFYRGQRDALNLLGSVSGRDRDKIKESGLTLDWVDGTPVFKEAALTITCRMLYREDFKKERFASEDIAKEVWGQDRPMHSLYIGEVVGVYVDE